MPFLLKISYALGYKNGILIPLADMTSSKVDSYHPSLMMG